VDGISHMSDVVLITESETGSFFARGNYDASKATEAVGHYFRIFGYFCEISLHPRRELCKRWPVVDL
jgi:hypothetical protein